METVLHELGHVAGICPEKAEPVAEIQPEMPQLLAVPTPGSPIGSPAQASPGGLAFGLSVSGNYPLLDSSSMPKQNEEPAATLTIKESNPLAGKSFYCFRA